VANTAAADTQNSMQQKAEEAQVQNKCKKTEKPNKQTVAEKIIERT